MPVSERTPLILFSGLAADADVFAPQRLAFPHLIVPPWPDPSPSDTLESYCERIADDLRPHGRIFIGGASFGGIIALHVARHLNPHAVFLIGSVRSPAELPRYARLARPLRPLIRFVPIRLLQSSLAPVALDAVRRWFPHQHGLARQFRGCDPTVFKWSLSRILDWDAIPDVPCPVFHVHGARDLILPPRCTRPDTVVKGGGHVISLTHPAEVNDFIRSSLLRTTGELSDASEPPRTIAPQAREGRPQQDCPPPAR